jgi:hypothetical protein
VPFDLHRLLEVVVRRLIYHANDLWALDVAIGDADNSLNMKRSYVVVLS